jgi:AI-2 transport protein TqsA
MNTTTQTSIPSGLRFLLSAACLVIVIAGMRAASTILVPLALALFIAVASLPLLNLARRKGMPTSLAILIVVLFDAAALFIFGSLVRLASLEVSNDYAMYLDRVRELEDTAIAWFASRGIAIDPLGEVWFPNRTAGEEVVPAGGELGWLFSMAGSVARWATDILTTIFLVVLIFIFMLAEAAKFGRKLRMIVGRDRLSRSSKIVREIQHFLAIKTLISAATGLTVGVAMWGLGVDFALLWGLLAFLLNFIPNVGSIIAAMPAIVVALLQIGPGAAVLVMVVYVGVNALFGNFLEPMLMGRQLGISTLVVILSLVFWGWVWGPIGMFLSVPLTMALKIGLENSPEFKWVAVLMASDGTEPPAVAAAEQAPEPATLATPQPSLLARGKKSPAT